MNKRSGFTLIELLIVVAIVAILVSVATPSYQKIVMRGHRSDAQSGLSQLAQALERFYGVNYTYVGTGVGGLGTTGSPVSTVFAYSSTPLGGPQTHYNLTVVVNATDYFVTATPVGRQVGDSCGALILSRSGAKAPANCW